MVPLDRQLAPEQKQYGEITLTNKYQKDQQIL